MQSTGSRGMGTSSYYLERVGLETYTKLRLNLRNGRNSFGRTDSRSSDIDFGIDSGRCSALHCIITVSGDSVEIVNKSKTVGTTVNETKIAEQSVQLKEDDIIGIVRGAMVPWDLEGNFNLFVYRLCKYTHDNILTIELDDDEPYEISDDDNANVDDEDVVILLDPIDIKVERDRNIELMRELNEEIKKEAFEEEFDELEKYFIPAKKERSYFFDIEPTAFIDLDPDEPDDVAHRLNEEYNPEMFRSESNDSIDTLIFSANYKQEVVDCSEDKPAMEVNHSDDDETVENVRLFVERDFERDTADIVENVKRKDGPQLVEPKQMKKRLKKTVNAEENESETNDSTDTLIFAPTHEQEDGGSVQNSPVDTSLTDGDSAGNVRLFAELNSEQVTAEKVHNAKRKELVEAKQTEKRQKKILNTKENERTRSTTQNVNKDKRTGIVNRKEKPKIASSTVTSKQEAKEKAKTSAKVKYTKDNRGAFLTDPSQMPGLPTPVKERRKSKFLVAQLPPPVRPLPNKDSKTDDTEIDDALSKLIDEDQQYSRYKVKKLSFSDLRKPMVNESSSASPIDRDESTPDSGYSEKVSLPKANNVSIGGEAFEAHESCTDVDIYKTPNGRTEMKEPEQNKPHKESVFQINPCHDVISIVTSYDFEQFKSVDLFCRSINTNDVPSFGDTFNDYSEYQGTILPLMMLELYKEIELEYENSKGHNFINVSAIYQDIERRGVGRRMVFHCQVEISCKSKCLYEAHLVLARCEWKLKEIEFLAMISSISYVRKAENLELAHFTLETSALDEKFPVKMLQIRPITVISNTLNAFRSVYGLHGPLLNLILNPLCGELTAKKPVKVAYKGFSKTLDTDQTSALKEIYFRCKNLNVPNISLVDGATGTGKSFLISDLALQLVYGDSLPRPLRILICSRSNRNIDEITKKLLYVRDKTSDKTLHKIQVVRFGSQLEQIDSECRCVSVQHLKETEQRFIQSASIDKLEEKKKTLELKVRALTLDDLNDNTMELKLWKSQLVKLNTLLRRLEAVDKTKLGDATTVLLNACDIICTTLGSITRLQSYIQHVDVCIIDESSQCNESLTLLPLRFGMPSLVLLGDSCLRPPMVYSEVANAKNYGNSLFRRVHKLYSSKLGSPIYHLNIQHRMHPEIVKWPNKYFYNNHLHQSAPNVLDNLPIVPYRMISYAPGMESDNIMLIVNFLASHIDTQKYSIGVICTNTKQKSVMRSKLSNHPNVGVYSASESFLVELDVVVVWISKEHGMSYLSDSTLLNRSVTRAKRCLLICGADLVFYKSLPMWKSMLEDAQERRCYVHLKKFLQVKLNTLLR